MGQHSRPLRDRRRAGDRDSAACKRMRAMPEAPYLRPIRTRHLKKQSWTASSASAREPTMGKPAQESGSSVLEDLKVGIAHPCRSRHPVSCLGTPHKHTRLWDTRCRLGVYAHRVAAVWARGQAGMSARSRTMSTPNSHAGSSWHRSQRREGLAAAPRGVDARTTRRSVGANDRIRIGIIGCGDRGIGTEMASVRDHAKDENLEVIAGTTPGAWPGRMRRRRPRSGSEPMRSSAGASTNCSASPMQTRCSSRRPITCTPPTSRRPRARASTFT